MTENDKPRRGRPSTGKAKTQAQIQREYRQRQKAKKNFGNVMDNASATGDRVLDDAFKPPGYPRESMRNLVLICTLRLRNSQHAELLRAVDFLQSKLRNLGHSDALPGKQKDGGYWYWNESPPVDYRSSDTEGDHTPHPTDDEARYWPDHDREL